MWICSDPMSIVHLFVKPHELQSQLSELGGRAGQQKWQSDILFFQDLKRVGMNQKRGNKNRGLKSTEGEA